MEVSARQATTSDLDAVTELAEDAVDELRALRGGEVWYRQSARHKPVSGTVEADLGDPAAHVVVGTIDDSIVGYGVIRREELSDGSVLGVISDLYSTPEARAVSVGETMMNAMLDWARAQGCFGVDSIALPGDRQTKNFFESFGLVARAITVHRSLGEE